MSRAGRIRQKIKRHIQVYIFPSRAKKQLDLRQGMCLRCGKCCRLVFRCPMLIGQTPPFRCRIYNHRSRLCRQFPMSAEDLRDVDYECGYKFTEKNQVFSRNFRNENQIAVPKLI